MIFLLCIVSAQFFFDICRIENGIISLDDGMVQGFAKKSYNGRTYLAFEGIPYAKPPVNELRFEDPQPPEPWLGILKANRLYICIQLTLLGVLFIPIGQEDCLYLNVYVPYINGKPGEDLDVIFNIHPGAFAIGSPSALSGPSKIMDRDVVYVSVNYRLGALGFYSPGDGTGNYGLKDQTMALKWIQRNIDKFGGNKDSVTLMGLSSGGASVHLHYFSPLSKGLFHKGFAQSGLALNPWAVRKNYVKNSKKLAKTVGCLGQTIKEVRKCLKRKSAVALTNALRSLYVGVNLLPLVLFGPVIEKNSSEAFLTKLPYWSLKSNEIADLPFLMSMTLDDGTIPAAFTYDRINEVDKDWKRWAPILFDYYLYNQTKQDEISEGPRQLYYGNARIAKNNYHGVVSACTHRIYHVGAIKTSMLQPQVVNSNIYYLKMGYAGEFRPVSTAGFDVNLGIAHGSDNKFYYDAPFIQRNESNSQEDAMKDVLLDMLASFAKTGKPTLPDVEFEPIPKNGELKYLMVFGPGDIRMITEVRKSNQQYYDFWDNLDDVKVAMIS